tara:strand:- start:182 stop:775 length:594 start_codon:yes stop_codon:yes gene_type:complete
MKKVLLLVAIVTLSAMQSFAQDSKFYIGIGVGYATAGGDAAGNAKGGINLNFLNTGYRFNESWGITANLGSSGFAIEDTDSAIGIGVFSFGPMYTISLSESMSWDLKPQYAASVKGAYSGDDVDASGFGDTELSGNGFMFGNSLIFGNGSKGFDFSIDLDYFTGKWTEVSISGVNLDIDEDNSINSFKIGVGVRYNF